MSTCPHHKLRSDLPPLTERIRKLPVDERGYPVPFFVAWLDGKPEFRMADQRKQERCRKHSLCWVCGELLNEPELAFVIGPMCGLNRISAEPPMHKECADWSVRGCPFLNKPNMERREHDKIAGIGSAGGGVMLTRNPGAMILWGTYSFHAIQAPNAQGGRGWLWQIGDPSSISFWRAGRPATRAEIIESIESGLPLLLASERTEERRALATVEIAKRYEELKHLLPPA